MTYTHHINKEKDPELIVAWLNQLALYDRLKLVTCVRDNVYIFEKIDKEDYT